MKTFAFIFARGGSKGLPNKNIKLLNGKPLISYSIDLAKKISAIDDIFVSTDSPEISHIAKRFGAKVIKRPKHLSKDNSPEILAWKHAINYLEKNNITFDVFLSLPATSPLREHNDVERCLNSLDKKNQMVVSISESNHSPWFNMVRENDEGLVEVVINENNPVFRRQDAPKVYTISTVAYVTTPNYIRYTEDIFDGKVKGVKIPKERSIDIDTQFDFKICDLILQDTNTGKK